MMSLTYLSLPVHLQVPVLDTSMPHSPGTLRGKAERVAADYIAENNISMYKRLMVGGWERWCRLNWVKSPHRHVQDGKQMERC
jgi:hypothetical protein